MHYARETRADFLSSYAQYMRVFANEGLTQLFVLLKYVNSVVFSCGGEKWEYLFERCTEIFVVY